MSRKISPIEQNKIFMSFLEEITEYSSSKNIIEKISTLLNLPHEIVKFELKYYFFLKFKNSQNKFKVNHNFFQYIFSYIKSYLVFFYLLFFSKKKCPDHANGYTTNGINKTKYQYSIWII